MDFHFILIHWIIPTYSISPMVPVSEHPSASSISLSSSVSIISPHALSTERNRKALFIQGREKYLPHKKRRAMAETGASG